MEQLTTQCAWRDSLTECTISVEGDTLPWLRQPCTRAGVGIRGYVARIWVTLRANADGQLSRAECNQPTIYSWNDRSLAQSVADMLQELPHVEELTMKQGEEQHVGDAGEIAEVLERLHPGANLLLI